MDSPPAVDRVPNILQSSGSILEITDNDINYVMISWIIFKNINGGRPSSTAVKCSLLLYVKADDRTVRLRGDVLI